VDGLREQRLLFALRRSRELRKCGVVQDRQVLHHQVPLHIRGIRRPALGGHRIALLVERKVRTFDPVVDQERLLAPEWRGQKIQHPQQLFETVRARLLQDRDPQ